MMWMILIGGVALVGVLFVSYFYNNMNYIKKLLATLYNAGFAEKQIQLQDGTVLNYGESPDNGKTPLLLIHGQGMSWEDYAKVLPELSKHYHVYAVDCHGHGESEYNQEKYSAEAMAADFTEFIKALDSEKF
jgi:pimeloyl-ACP methyl ester carboxylesterase